jgi:hypothetical protein
MSGLLAAGHCEQNDAGLSAGDGEFDPALFAIEGLVGGDAEAQFFGIEGEGAVLVCDRDTRKLV